MFESFLSKTQYAVRAIGLNCQNLTKNGNRKKLNATCFPVILFDCIVQCLKVISILICVASLFDLLFVFSFRETPFVFFQSPSLLVSFSSED